MMTSHFCAEPLKIQRTFILQNQLTLQTKVIHFDVFIQNGRVDLLPLFTHALSDYKNLTFKIYDFRLNKYLEIQSFGFRSQVPNYIIEDGPHVVLIKYSASNSETLSVQSHENSLFNDNRSEIRSKKSERSKERIILQVIQIVKKWRSLHDSKKGTSMNLPEAAKIVGLPKKSLDDYYYQLRMGQKYGFDFHHHMMDGIGVLRSFLKDFKNRRKMDKNDKLPHGLKIAEQISRYETIYKCNSQSVLQQNYEKMDEEQDQICEKSKKQCIEKDFYNQFNYDFGKETDPFLSLGKGNEMKSILNIDLSGSGNFDLFF